MLSDDHIGDFEEDDIVAVDKHSSKPDSILALRAHMIFPSALRRARQALVRHCLDNEFDLYRYLAGLRNLPIPPTCFFADEDMMTSCLLPFVRKGALKTRYGDYLVIDERRDSTDRTTVACGIVPTQGIQSFVGLASVYSMLAFRYMSQDIFEDRVSYCPGMDYVYRRVLQDKSGLAMNE